jgi:uncharacterized protein
VATALGDALTALGLVLVIEGLIFAAAPDSARRALTLMLTQPAALLRILGMVSMVAGLALVWVVRG